MQTITITGIETPPTYEVEEIEQITNDYGVTNPRGVPPVPCNAAAESYLRGSILEQAELI